MKSYIDIKNLRNEDIIIAGAVTRARNDGLFYNGDTISITEKRDGSNFSATWQEGKVAAFSRRMELDEKNTLQGAYNYVMTLDSHIFSDNPDYIVFGEWGCKNKINYTDRNSVWYIFDIYSKSNDCWLTPEEVKAFCVKYGLTYIHELYYGKFISWEHCQTFCNSPAYGDKQEGIVIRNVDKLNQYMRGNPFILKIVNADFKESQVSKKMIDPAVEAAKEQANIALASVVTYNRVEKLLHKLQEDNIIPTTLSEKDIGTIAKVLPKKVYEDCVKEENEIMSAYSEYAGRICGSLTMAYVRKMILG
jgi:hypothetical protein